MPSLPENIPIPLKMPRHRYIMLEAGQVLMAYIIRIFDKIRSVICNCQNQPRNIYPNDFPSLADAIKPNIHYANTEKYSGSLKTNSENWPQKTIKKEV